MIAATAQEIVKELYIRGNKSAVHAHKRLSELERQGVVEKVGWRMCLVTRRKACTWQVTGRRPKLIMSKKKKKRAVVVVGSCEECPLLLEGGDCGHEDQCPRSAMSFNHVSDLCPLRQREVVVRAKR